jgi:serine/threonine protein kinase
VASDALPPTNSPSQSVECLLCGAANSRADSTCASCGSPLSPATPGDNSLAALDVSQVGFTRALPPQTTLRSGDYRVLGVLGQGGFGITYRAANERLGREVAIKEFFPATCERVGRGVSASGGLSEPDFASLKAAFLEEARVLARFELPAVVRVMGAWEENASAYMEMELLRGPTLAQVLDERGKLPIEDTVRLFAPLLDALEHIHAQGWLHRDIKPHNIIFEPPAIASAHPAHLKLSECRAVLLDFGAAKKLAANTSQAFSVIVTPGYAPLEQYATRARRGAFTDIYALCATVYHALSGQAPPAASDRALYDDLIPLRELRPEVPAVLAHAIEAGLRTEIARRPQNIGELRQLLASRTGPLDYTPDAVDALAGEAGSRPNLGRLSARQQARLNSIHSANQDAIQKPAPPVAAPRVEALRLPVPNVRQVLADAIESERRAAETTPPPKPAPAASVPSTDAAVPNSSGAVAEATAETTSKTPAPALPQARSTAGAAGRGGHAHRSGLGNRVNHNAPEAWNNATYIVAAGIALIAVGPLLLIANALLSPPPPPPPTVIVPQEVRPRAGQAPAPEAAAETALDSPDGRFRGVDMSGSLYFWSSKYSKPGFPNEPSLLLPIPAQAPGEGRPVPGERLWSIVWTPDSRHLLVAICLNPRPLGQRAIDDRRVMKCMLFQAGTWRKLWEQKQVLWVGRPPEQDGSLSNARRIDSTRIWLWQGRWNCFDIQTGALLQQQPPSGVKFLNGPLPIPQANENAAELNNRFFNAAFGP